MDITIKDVPEGAEEEVKKLAMVAIERFMLKPLQPAEADVKTFQDGLDAILKKNGMSAKFTVEEDNAKV